MDELEIKEADAVLLVRRLDEIKKIFSIEKTKMDESQSQADKYSGLVEATQDKISELEEEVSEYESLATSYDEAAGVSEEVIGELNDEIWEIEQRLELFDHVPKGLSDDKTLELFSSKI